MSLGAVFVLAAVLAAYAALVWRVVVLVRRAQVRPVVLRASAAVAPADAIERLVDGLVPRLHRQGFLLVHRTDSALRFERSYRPTWAVLTAALLCWLLWPLLLLLITRRAVLDVTARASPDGTALSVAGAATDAAQDVVTSELDEASPQTGDQITADVGLSSRPTRARHVGGVE